MSQSSATIDSPMTAAQHVESVVRSSGTSFLWGMRILPEPRRRAMFAIYAFCREVDDVADEPGTQKAKLAELEDWRREIDNLFEGHPSRPTTKALAGPIRDFELPKEEFLAIVDGNKGLGKAVKTTWPWIEVQRCTNHKLQNLYTHAPKRHYEEIKADYDAIIRAKTRKTAKAAWTRFERKWEKTCPGVVTSLQEAGDDLLTFFNYPKAMWKCLRTTNCIERANEEFRRRVKTQGSFPDPAAGPRLLFGLVATSQIRFRRIDGWKQLASVVRVKRLAMGLVKPLDNAA